MDQPSSEEENHANEPSETTPVSTEYPTTAEEQSVLPPENPASAEEQSATPPENAPTRETPMLIISVEYNDDANEKELSPNHRRGTTIDFHDLLSVNAKLEKMHHSQSISTMRRSLDGLLEEREITQFPNGADGMPIRVRVRGNGGYERQVTSRGFVETQTSLESVKSVVSKFGGSVDWRFQGSNVPQKFQNQQVSLFQCIYLFVYFF
jgi:hypothetical protein